MTSTIGMHGSLLLVVEEPEAHLHPLAQRWVGRVLTDLAGAGVQVVVTTHSPAFVNILCLEGMVVVRKDGCTSATQLSREELAMHCRNTGAAMAREINILEFYVAAATHERYCPAYSRERSFSFEGPTEALTLPHYLERVGLRPSVKE